jgi:hypothetical protein
VSERQRVRGILIYCQDFHCSHSIAVSADKWPDHVRREVGTPSMMGDGALPAALSKPFLLKITLMHVLSQGCAFASSEQSAGRPFARFARFLPQSTFKGLKGIGHLAPLEAPEALAEACKSFPQAL